MPVEGTDGRPWSEPITTRTRVLASLVALTMTLAACGGRDESVDAAFVRRGPPTEPLSVRVGGREIRVRCGVECDEIAMELSQIHEDCVDDPMSTPHHVSTRPELVSLGCCTVARAAYEEGCGIEGALSCVSAWNVVCERGGGS